MTEHLNKNMVREEYVINGIRGWVLEKIYGHKVKRVVYNDNAYKQAFNILILKKNSYWCI